MRISDWSSDVCSSDLDAEINAVAHAPGRGLHVPAEDPFLGRTDALQRAPRLVVERIGLELDAHQAQRLERVAQHQILRFSVDRRALMRRRQPGPADLGATMAMIERTKTRAADDLPACDVDLHKWQGRTRVAGRQNTIDEMANAFGRCGRIRIQRPDRRIDGDRDQRHTMQGLRRLTRYNENRAWKK